MLEFVCDVGCWMKHYSGHLIGYGLTFPKTLTGQMFTLLYTFFAVGVNFAMLTMVGNAFADFLTYSYR